MEHPLFSVIIPVYNYGHTFERAIASVMSQKSDDTEVIVINDGSTDNSGEIIDRFESHYHQAFRTIHQSNRGLAGTRNRGIEESTGQYLIFLDADDELAENALNHLRQCISSSSKIDMVIGAHTSVEPDGTKRFRPRPELHNLKQGAFKAYLLDEKLPIANGATAMHRKIFNRYRYPEHLRCVEDIPMFSYVLANYHCITLNQPIAMIHKHPDSMRNNTALELSVGTKVVEEVFAEGRIPSGLMHFRKDYLTHRYLSIFRTLYLAGEYRQALEYYQKAISNSWKTILQLSPLRKAIRAFIRKGE